MIGEECGTRMARPGPALILHCRKGVDGLSKFFVFFWLTRHRHTTAMAIPPITSRGDTLPRHYTAPKFRTRDLEYLHLGVTLKRRPLGPRKATSGLEVHVQTATSRTPARATWFVMPGSMTRFWPTYTNVHSLLATTRGSQEKISSRLI